MSEQDRQVRRGETSFDLDRALDWLERIDDPDVAKARRLLLKAQARFGFARGQASAEYLAEQRSKQS